MINVLEQYKRRKNMSKELEVFRKEFCFTKEDVQISFEKFVEHYRISNEEDQYRKCFLELCSRFKEALDRCNLPILKDDWWFYDYEQTNDGFVLKLNFCKELQLDENEEIDSMTGSEDFTLLNVKCDYYTVEQYSTIHQVTPTTVRQWIRRGKLRTAKKIGRDWLIPAIADKPTRGFESVSYTWDSLPKGIEESYPFLEGFNYVYICQDEEQKTLFNCIMGYPGQSNRVKIPLTLKEREKFELDLITNPAISVLPSGVMFNPSKY
jgi:hypothetical protein